MKLDIVAKKQFLGSLENQKRELLNIQQKIVNLRLLEKNLIKSIKKKQQAFKLSLKEHEVPTSKMRGIFLSESFDPLSLVEVLGFHSSLLETPVLLDLEYFE